MTDQMPRPMPDPSLPRTTDMPRRPWRWVTALLVTLAMLFAMTGVAVVAQTGETGGPRFVPANAVAYAEVRLDLPGDQHDQLAAFMSHFPGFADPSTFDTKIDEMLDQALSQASKGAATWTGNVKPWSNGQFAMAITSLPASAATDGAAAPSIVVGLGISDRAALEAQIAQLHLGPSASPAASPETYQGATIVTSDDGRTSFAISDTYLLFSNSRADLQASLDTLAGSAPGLASDPDYQAAVATMVSPNLGHFFVRTSALIPLLQQSMANTPGGAALAGQLAKVPAWAAGYLQVASDHLTLGGSVPLTAGGFQPSVRTTDLAAQFPSGTLGYLEVRDLGTLIDAFLGQVKAGLASSPGNNQTLTGIEQQLGPLDKLLEFVDDAALGISLDGQTPSVGIVATLNDPAKGAARIQTILGLLRILSGGSNAPYTVTTSQVDGVTVTTITLTSASGIPSSLPFQPAISVAVRGDHLYLGLADFASTALAQDAASSLTSDPRFTTAVGDPATPNGGILWVDLAALAPLIQNAVGTSDPAFLTNAGPWLSALDSFSTTTTVDGDTFRSRTVLFVK